MSVCRSRARRSTIAPSFLVRLCPTILVLLSTGCAGPMGTIHSDTATAPVTEFDGTYRSAIQVTSSPDEVKGTTAWCVTPGQPIITVANGQFSYAVPHPNVPGNPTPTFQATVAQDGSFSGQANNGTISGRVAATHMEGTINGAGCIYAFTGDRM